MNAVDKIIRMPIREAFPFEYKDFTPWICDNIDVIGESVGFEIINPQREQTTGNFNVDIKAENENGDVVIIENQYGASDHDHLGKLITYLTSFDAKAAIWVVETPKQEHINAISWLNEKDNGCDFYLLRVEAIKIGESSLAPLLSKIAGPSEESKQIGKLKKEHTIQDAQRAKFWDQLFISLNKIGLKQFAAVNASGKDSWVGATAGIKGFTYVFWVNQYSTRIELRIDRGKGSDEENLQLLNKLKTHKEEIESFFGSDLNWAELEGYRVCSVRKDFDLGGYKSDEEEWPMIIEKTVGSMHKLIDATKKHLYEFKANA
jgi:hypothetical protein